MNSGGGGAVGSAASGGTTTTRSPFTVSQWQELEHQALIFKYMMAGLPVPPDLVLPIQRSFGSVSHSFPHYSPLGYCSFYGKKVDPEPGRCRRTDGKKWRCSKDAYPDSKYCERHMHRGRNRSRKPVESQTLSSTTVTTTGSSCGTGSFPNLQLHHSFGNHQSTGSVTNQPNYLDSIPYGIPNKDYRYLKPAEMGEHGYFSGASGSNKGLQPLDSAFPLMPTSVSLYPQSKPSENSIMQNDYPHGSYFSSGFASGEVAKQEGQSLRPFFQEWPKARESWDGLKDERSVSTTQLSISVPMASSDFSATSSQSPHDN